MHECKHKPPKLQAHTCELNEQVSDVKIFTFLLHCSIVCGIVVIEWTTSKFNFILFFSHSTLSEIQKEFIVSRIILSLKINLSLFLSVHFISFDIIFTFLYIASEIIGTFKRKKDQKQNYIQYRDRRLWTYWTYPSSSCLFPFNKKTTIITVHVWELCFFLREESSTLLSNQNV